MRYIGRSHNAEVVALLSTQLALYMAIFALGSVPRYLGVQPVPLSPRELAYLNT